MRKCRKLFLSLSFLFLLALAFIPLGCSEGRLSKSLFQAVLCCPDEIQLWIERGEDVNAIRKTRYDDYTQAGDIRRDVIDQTYLSIAVRHGRTEAVRILLANGADPDLGSADKGYTALAWAARIENDEIVEALLDAGADPNLRMETPDSEGEYPIIWAARSRNVELVKMLLAHQARHDVRNSEGDTCLDIAERCNNEQVVKTLAALGVS